MSEVRITCCEQVIATIEVSDDGTVAVRAPEGEKVYQLNAFAKIPDLETLARDGEIEFVSSDKKHALMMQCTLDEHVSEILWPAGSTWVFRCLSCKTQCEMNPDRFRRFTIKLAAVQGTGVVGAIQLGGIDKILSAVLP